MQYLYPKQDFNQRNKSKVLMDEQPLINPKQGAIVIEISIMFLAKQYIIVRHGVRYVNANKV